jgi:hypothetical protein
MSSVYRNYMNNLKNLLNIQQQPTAPIPSFSYIPQPEQGPASIDASAAALAVEKIFAMRQRIINAIIAKNRL